MKIRHGMRAAVLLGLVFAGTVHAQDLTELPLDGYAAKVNDEVITIGDVAAITRAADERLRILYAGEELTRQRAAMFRSGLRQLIENKLIAAEFDTLEGQIPDRIVDDRIDQIIKERFNNDRAAFLEALATEQRTYQEWKDEVREHMIVGLMRRQEVIDKVAISPGQVRRIYEEEQSRYNVKPQIRLRMIFLRHGEDEEEDNRKREELVIARGRLVTEDAIFADVARELSEDTLAENGGDWGWIEPTMLRNELQAVAAELKEGEISEIIDTEDGYYLMMIDERKDAGRKSFDTVREEIEEELTEKETERLYKDWIDRLRRKFYIKLYEGIPDPFTEP